MDVRSIFVFVFIRLIELIHIGIVKDNSLREASGSNLGISLMEGLLTTGCGFGCAEVSSSRYLVRLYWTKGTLFSLIRWCIFFISVGESFEIPIMFSWEILYLPDKILWASSGSCDLIISIAFVKVEYLCTVAWVIWFSLAIRCAVLCREALSTTLKSAGKSSSGGMVY